jgi:hypothetical protein
MNRSNGGVCTVENLDTVKAPLAESQMANSNYWFENGQGDVVLPTQSTF